MESDLRLLMAQQQHQGQEKLHQMEDPPSEDAPTSEMLTLGHKWSTVKIDERLFVGSESFSSTSDVKATNSANGRRFPPTQRRRLVHGGGWARRTASTSNRGKTETTLLCWCWCWCWSDVSVHKVCSESSSVTAHMFDIRPDIILSYTTFSHTVDTMYSFFYRNRCQYFVSLG